MPLFHKLSSFKFANFPISESSSSIKLQLKSSICSFLQPTRKSGKLLSRLWAKLIEFKRGKRLVPSRSFKCMFVKCILDRFKRTSWLKSYLAKMLTTMWRNGSLFSQLYASPTLFNCSASMHLLSNMKQGSALPFDFENTDMFLFVFVDFVIGFGFSESRTEALVGVLFIDSLYFLLVLLSFEGRVYLLQSTDDGLQLFFGFSADQHYYTQQTEQVESQFFQAVNSSSFCLGCLFRVDFLLSAVFWTIKDLLELDLSFPIFSGSHLSCFPFSFINSCQIIFVICFCFSNSFKSSCFSSRNLIIICLSCEVFSLISTTDSLNSLRRRKRLDLSSVKGSLQLGQGMAVRGGRSAKKQRRQLRQQWCWFEHSSMGQRSSSLQESQQMGQVSIKLSRIAKGLSILTISIRINQEQ